MDDTPISWHRMVLGFGVTVAVALFPVLYVLLQLDVRPISPMVDAVGGYRGLVIAAGIVIMTLLVVLAVMTVVARRAARRPTRA